MAQAPGLDRPGVNAGPRTGASEATERIRQKNAPDWSIRGRQAHGPNPPPDWIVRGRTRCRGLEHPGTQRTRTGASGDKAAREWNVRGNKQGEGDGGGEKRRREQEQEQGTDGGGQEGEKTRSGRRKRRRRSSQTHGARMGTTGEAAQPVRINRERGGTGDHQAGATEAP